LGRQTQTAGPEAGMGGSEVIGNLAGALGSPVCPPGDLRPTRGEHSAQHPKEDFKRPEPNANRAG
jgi:hypothetical protein